VDVILIGRSSFLRRHLCYKLSLHDLVEMVAKRGLSRAHTTILR
jgi:transposase-like protein